jgi:hypothetical protein
MALVLRLGLDELFWIRLAAESIDCRLVAQPGDGLKVGACERDRIAGLNTNRAPAMARNHLLLRNTVRVPLMMPGTRPIRLRYSSSTLPGAESIDFA